MESKWKTKSEEWPSELSGGHFCFIRLIRLTNNFVRQLLYFTSTQHPDQQRYDEDDDKERRAKAAQKMMHSDLSKRLHDPIHLRDGIERTNLYMANSATDFGIMIIESAKVFQ